MRPAIKRCYYVHLGLNLGFKFLNPNSAVDFEAKPLLVDRKQPRCCTANAESVSVKHEITHRRSNLTQTLLKVIAHQ